MSFYARLRSIPLRRALVPVALAAILLLAAAFRIHGLAWDHSFGANPHPDERHLAYTMGRISLSWPPDWSALADAATSPLNPRRINPADGSHYDLAYGTLPIYIYRAVAALAPGLGAPGLNTLDGFYLVGRGVTVVFALVSVLLAFAVAAMIYGPPAGLLAAGLLAISVTHIQLSHFMTVDLGLSMFAIGAVYWGLRFARRGGRGNVLLLGISVGAAMACKISGATLLAVIAASYLLWATGPASRLTQRRLLRGAGFALLTLLGILLLFGVFEFYVFLDPSTYIAALANQAEMVTGANDWPFTRQYVNTTPYLYHLEGLVRWGLGWPLGLASLGGLVFGGAWALWRLLPPGKSRRGRGIRAFHDLYYSEKLRGTALLLLWVLPYLAYVGRYEVKFMRYMLPLVPALCIFAAQLLIAVASRARTIGCRLDDSVWVRLHLRADGGPGAAVLARALPVLVFGVVLIPTFIWALAFSSIYARDHTWYDASKWLYANVPSGATISSEAWDDALPIEIPTEGGTRGSYSTSATFSIYHDMSPEDKLDHLISTVRRSDYIVLATARLYGAVRRLPWRYPVEIKYYELLFREQLGFELAYTSMSYPHIWGITFVDDAADESFSVYDHPKVLIYRKVRNLSDAELRALFGDVLRLTPSTTRVGMDPPVVLPVPEYRKPLMLSVPVDALADVGDYGWNRAASRSAVLSTLIWLVVLGLITVAAFPLSNAVFGRFADRGYLLGKALGILVIAYFAWMPSSLGLWNYTFGSVFMALLGLLGLSAGLVRWRGLAPKALWKENARLMIRCEALFFVAFLLGLALRLGNPDTWHYVNGGEKPMEFGFLNAILRSPAMPPLDPFFSGGYINYYYYGLFAVSTLVKLTGLLPGVAFNLIIPTLVALTIGGAYAVVATMAGKRRWGIAAGLLTAIAGPLGGAVAVRGRGGFGEVIAALQQLAESETRGALARLWQGFWRWVGPAKLAIRTDWFWDASRFHGPYENTITEFPFWSFLFADLHPHTINIPFTVLAIALALRIARSDSGGEQSGCRAVPAWVVFLLTAFVLGSLAVTNSWDFPTFLLLSGGALVAAHLLAPRLGDLCPPLRVAATMAIGLVSASILGLLSLGLYFPFFTHFRAFVKGVGRVSYPTEIPYYLGFFGFFVFVIGTLLLWRAFEDRKRRSESREPSPPEAIDLVRGGSARGADAVHGIELEPVPLPENRVAAIVPSEAGGQIARPLGLAAARLAPLLQRLALSLKWTRSWLARNALLAASLVLAFGLAIVAGLIYPSLNWLQWLTLWMLCELIFLACAVAVREQGKDRDKVFGWWMVVVGIVVSLGIEVFYIRDHLGGTWYRMNTIFKFYVHTWVILALASAWAMGELAHAKWKRDTFAGGMWQVVLAGMAVVIFAYPVFATQSRWRDRFPEPPKWGTLDGLAYMKTATYNWDGHQISLESDLDAIRWLTENLSGTPVILQAPYGYYRENGVRIAANTGFPTVLNPLHENEQRYDELIGPRHRDADAIYQTRDIDEAERLLAKYGVGYIYTGGFERAVYPPEGLAKFDEMLSSGALELVYDEGKVRLYRVGDRVRVRFGGRASDAALPVQLPTVEPKPAEDLTDSALKALERAADASKDNPGLQFDLGDRYRRLGRLDDAVRVFERSLTLHPDDVAMYHTLGDTYAQMGEMDRALDQYLAAAQVAATNPAVYNKLGMAYMERERWEEAVQAFRNTVDIDPAFAESYFHMGTSLERIDRRDEAMTAYERARLIGADTDWEARAEERLRVLGQ